MAAGPQFAGNPNMGILSTNQLSVTNTNKDGSTGTYVQFFTAGPQGARVDAFVLIALVTTAATIVRLFVSDRTAANFRMFLEIPVTAVTPSATVIGFTATVANPVPYIPPFAQMKASIDAAPAGSINIFAVGGDL